VAVAIPPQFFMIEYLALTFTLLAYFYVVTGKKRGFILGIISSCLWIAWNITLASVPFIVLQCTFIYINIKGFLKHG
jgi:hypothetical protein